ncbi:hypothetical protein [Hymenobacter lapidiphilus]|uniref:Uncharacterized protein n=1 Tax=Hymenobacter lapidiphilus TaxID=2608003 RepID=A0A7Y7PT15_9BACT|nr:hypothetical protein [Hymenobacter lapidiphilus]NVO33520.1 hypothetical protein [Hymenobacter lapidiphilus]
MFLLQCRENFFLGITPANLLQRAEPGPQKLVELYTRFIGANQIVAFVGLLQEGQYYINLWAAHLLVEHHHPDGPTHQICMDTIERYANSSIDPKVAQQELEWLRRQAQAYPFFN